MNGIGMRIKQRREELDINQEELADWIMLNKSTVQRYETGEILKIKKPVLRAIAKKLDVSVEWLETGAGDKKWREEVTLDNILPLPRMKKIPVVGTIACGSPILAYENIDGVALCPEDEDVDFCLRCKGDSMIGARINDGDLVFIRHQDTVDDGQIAAILIDDEATLKRVYRTDNGIMLVAENPAYRPIIFTGESAENIRILGLAVSFVSRIK